jgi:hypothetical protein
VATPPISKKNPNTSSPVEMMVDSFSFIFVSPNI